MAGLRARVRDAFLMLLVGSAVAIGGCSSESASDTLEIHNPRLVQAQSGQRSFTGTLVNEGRRPISIAQIEVALYDNTGSPVETIRIEVENIPPQDSTDFSHRIDSDRPFQQAQVQSIMTP